MQVAIIHRDLHAVTRGGICTLYLALAAELATAGHHVTLVTQETPHPVSAEGVEVHTLPRTDDLPAHRRAVASLLAELRPDVAECSTWEAELLDYLKLPGRAPVLVRSDLSAATMGAADLAGDEKVLCQAADAVVAVSEFAAGDLAAAYGIARPSMIANGVDRTRFTSHGHRVPRSGWQVDLSPDGEVMNRRPLPDLLATDPAWASYFHGAGETPRLVWVGKFTQMKGFDRLQQIAHRLAGRARLLILLGHGQVHYPVDLPPEVLLCQDLVADLIVDDTSALWQHLAAGASGTVHLVADNSGHELLADLMLIDHLLHTGRTEQVELHLKSYPYYISDATTDDLLACLRRLTNAGGEAAAVGSRLWQALTSGRLRLEAHRFWTAPLTFHDLPPELATRFAHARLVIVKGDLNYRRLVGDLHWPATTSFAAATSYFPGPVAALRTLKSDVVIGLSSDTLAQLDGSGEAWRISGTHAMAQLRT